MTAGDRYKRGEVKLVQEKRMFEPANPRQVTAGSRYMRVEVRLVQEKRMFGTAGQRQVIAGDRYKRAGVVLVQEKRMFGTTGQRQVTAGDRYERAEVMLVQEQRKGEAAGGMGEPPAGRGRAASPGDEPIGREWDLRRVRPDPRGTPDLRCPGAGG